MKLLHELCAHSAQDWQLEWTHQVPCVCGFSKRIQITFEEIRLELDILLGRNGNAFSSLIMNVNNEDIIGSARFVDGLEDPRFFKLLPHKLLRGEVITDFGPHDAILTVTAFIMESRDVHELAAVKYEALRLRLRLRLLRQKAHRHGRKNKHEQPSYVFAHMRSVSRI